jgi:hypothetical protein
MAIDATPSGPDSNSYGTLAEAEAYFQNSRMNFDVWDASVEQEQALLYACLMLDRYDYIGLPVYNTMEEDGYLEDSPVVQALKWPRQLSDGELVRNYPVDIVPTPIKYAQFEAAIYYISTGGVVGAVAAGAVESLKIGNSIEAKYSTGSSGGSVVSTTTDVTGLPNGAARYLKGLRLYSVIG